MYSPRYIQSSSCSQKQDWVVLALTLEGCLEPVVQPAAKVHDLSSHRPSTRWVTVTFFSSNTFQNNCWTKEPGSNSSWDPDRRISKEAVVPYTALATTESPQTGEPLTALKSLLSANLKAWLSSFVPKITTDYQDKYVRTVGTTDSSASVCAGCGIHFVWAGAQGAPLGETELLWILLTCDNCIFFTHCSPSVIVSLFWFSLYPCRARLFVLSLSYSYCAAIVINSTV